MVREAVIVRGLGPNPAWSLLGGSCDVGLLLARYSSHPPLGCWGRETRARIVNGKQLARANCLF